MKINTHISEQRVHNTHITANVTHITASKYIMWLLGTIMHHLNCTWRYYVVHSHKIMEYVHIIST